MNREKFLRKCPGCGAELQFDRPGVLGFIPLDVYNKRLSEGKEILCQRCFKLKHYGMLIEEIDEEEILDFLKKFLNKFQSVMYVIDILDFEGTYRTEINEMIKDKNVIYVVNKFDALPKFVSAKQLKKWLTERILSVKEGKNKIFVTSTKNGFGISKLKETLERMAGEMLVIGVTNVGKSSLLKMLVSSKATVSPYPGTTVGVIKHKIGNLKIFDTPGIMVNDRMIDLFDVVCQGQILARGTITRKTFKPKSNEVLFVGGFCRIQAELVDNPNFKPIFQIYAPENVTFHKTSNPDFLENYQKHFGRLLTPPCSKYDISKIKFKTVVLNVDEGSEISIPGLCWINIKRGISRFYIHLPENVSVYIRPALIKPQRKVNKN
ncbi:MAG: ribosome biogenesis GTPase YqeH [Fervidobacterium sp.]